MLSIDQNCHSLWDVLPKLQALAAHGKKVTHFIEDIDVAFTSAGAEVGSAPLQLTREQYHAGGMADWGAALFYSEFLGRLPSDLRRWEPYTGMKTSVAARKLGRDVAELYDEFSPSDNWQLIGPSYVADRQHHRLIGDLSVAETADFIREIIAKARANCMETFVQDDCRQRLTAWFNRESQLVEELLARCAGAKLVDLYRLWLRRHLGPEAKLEMTSSLFALDADDARMAMLEVFLKDYGQAAGLYNEAIAEADVGLRPLKTSAGELPFFATLAHRGHLVRTASHLDGDKLRIADREFKLSSERKLPIEDMASAGICCLAGKAIVLVIQVRLGPNGDELALPYRGSDYMPAAVLLAKKLAAADLLPGRLRPIVRVRFGLLDRLRQVETVVRLPEHLRGYFGRDEVPASQIGQNYTSIAQQAAERLDSFRTDSGRARWQRETFPDIARDIENLEQQRRALAQIDPKAPEIRPLGKRQKRLQVRLLEELFRQIARDTQSAQIDYWDSRGALLPWCIALGGQEMYNQLIAEADIYQEPAT